MFWVPGGEEGEGALRGVAQPQPQGVSSERAFPPRILRREGLLGECKARGDDPSASLRPQPHLFLCGLWRLLT